MKKSELKQKTDAVINETHDALQTVFDGLNKGQRQKLLKDERIKSLMERYGIDTNDS